MSSGGTQAGRVRVDRANSLRRARDPKCASDSGAWQALLRLQRSFERNGRAHQFRTCGRTSLITNPHFDLVSEQVQIPRHLLELDAAKRHCDSVSRRVAHPATQLYRHTRSTAFRRFHGTRAQKRASCPPVGNAQLQSADPSPLYHHQTIRGDGRP